MIKYTIKASTKIYKLADNKSGNIGSINDKNAIPATNPITETPTVNPPTKQEYSTKTKKPTNFMVLILSALHYKQEAGR